MADGGLRVIFDLPESAIDAATQMIQAKQAGVVLEIAALPIIKERLDPMVEQLQDVE